MNFDSFVPETGKKNRNKFFYCEIKHLIFPEFLFLLHFRWDILLSMPGKNIMSLQKTMEHEPGQSNQGTSAIPVWKCRNKYYRADKGIPLLSGTVKLNSLYIYHMV